MIIRIFILTYKDPGALNKNLKSLFDNMGPVPSHVKIEPHIINNHSDFFIEDHFANRVNVFHNTLRIPESRGHLSRDWNQALLNGFRNIASPHCNIVSTLHDDMIWSNNWVHSLLDIHSKFDFYTCSWGDGFCSYTPEAVRKIGIWDERFCTNGIQECDYFLRALIYHKDRSSINCNGTGMVNNPYGILGVYEPPAQHSRESWEVPNPNYLVNRTNHENSRYAGVLGNDHKYMKELFGYKWSVNPEFWSEELIENLPKRPNVPTYMIYPYFECDIEDLPGKGYV